MREIKFRGFCKVRDAVWRQDPDYIDLDGRCFDKCWSDLVEDEDYFLVQYTGFKDKDGTEIFEKDIVHIVGVIPGVEIDEIGIVKFIEGSWMIENLKGNDGWMLFQEGTEIEVLGNVFENPELLQGGTGE
ncbi:YopX family protein [Bacillus sp. GKis3/1]|uniref:YopX family protein n=1 Tax=Bacillus sp. GKis3/1 TaxID=3418492 RepID=UPI003CEF95B3